MRLLIVSGLWTKIPTTRDAKISSASLLKPIDRCQNQRCRFHRSQSNGIRIKCGPDAWGARNLVFVDTLATDRRQKILRPADSLIREVGRSCAAFVDCYCAIAESSLAPPIKEDAGLLGELIHLSATRVRGSGTVIARYPRVLALSGYDCGYPMLVTLILAHYRRRSGKGMFSRTHSALAERFQVSVSHVGNLLGHLREVGALAPLRESEDVIVVEELVEEFERWCAAEMTHYADLARICFLRPERS